jgi:hypothetical protein
MTTTLRIAFIALVCFSLQTVHAQVRNADTMIQKIFATLKAKDQQGFVALYPNADQFGRFIRSIMEQTLKSEQVRSMMAKDEKTKNLNLDSLIDAELAKETSPEKFAATQQQFAKTFQQIIEKGEKKGVNWSQAKLTSYTIDSADLGNQAGMPFQLKGLKEAKGVIDFTVGDSAYQLAYNKMMFIESEGGWFGADFSQLARKGESLAPDVAMNDEEDSTTTTTTGTTKPVNASKGKAKTTTKKPVAKSSANTKSPARKPKTKS